MNYAVINDNVVVNIVISDDEYAKSQGWVLLPDGIGIGWSYINGEFVDNRPVPEE